MLDKLEELVKETNEQVDVVKRNQKQKKLAEKYKKTLKIIKQKLLKAQNHRQPV